MQLQNLIVSAPIALATAAPCAAQGTFGLGARLNMVRGDIQADPAATAQRFTGGQIRARLSPKTSVEIALDLRTETSVDLSQRVRDYPLQSPHPPVPDPLHLFAIRARRRRLVHARCGHNGRRKAIESVSTQKMGYHARLGAEMKVGRHAGVHADYRYTMVHFGNGTGATALTSAVAATGSGAGTSGLASRFAPSYDGSMWTAGFTLYF
ncbi:MAG TPA: hypothetical protein VEL51_14250 [Vicinamibacterales bacterium]|nr:hypothetical protein [Vicinamibacterales bacterium]